MIGAFGLNLRTVALALTILMIVAPGLGVSAALATELHQGAKARDTQDFRFGYNSIPKIQVSGAPADTDWARWAMLHDGEVYRLYAFRQGSDSEIYQFGFNRQTERYEWGHRSIKVLRLIGAPANASTAQFAMLHDGSVYRLYLQDEVDPTRLHQFGFDASRESYVYGHMSIKHLRVVGFPPDTDWRRWAMAHDGSEYRIFIGRRGYRHEFYQAAYEADPQSYRFGHRSAPKATMRGFLAAADRSSFAMLHDGADFRVYFQSE